MKVLSAFSVALVLAAAPLAADPATKAGAAGIAAALSRYVGSVEGLLRVEPQGETYRLTLDPARMLPALASIVGSFGIAHGDVRLQASPENWTLQDQGAGKWAVSSDGDRSFELVAGDMFSGAMAVDTLTYRGVFDESLRAVTSDETTFTGFTSRVTTRLPNQPEEVTAQTIASGRFHSEAHAGARAGVDASQGFVLEGIERTQLVPFAPTMPPIEIRSRTDTYAGETSTTGLRNVALLDLLAFFVAHPTLEEVKAAPEDLRAALGALGPVMETLKAEVSAGRTEVVTPIGTFGIGAMGLNLDMTGLVAEARLRQRVDLSGVSAPEGVLPPWATPLMPTDAVLDFEAGGVDLAAPLAVLIAEIDLNSGALAPEAEARVKSLFLPEGRAADLILHGSRIAGADYEATFELAGKVTAMGPPTVTGVVRLTGIQTIQSALNAAPAEVVRQFGPLVALAVGMARRDGDVLVWELDGSEPGHFRVNGMSLGGGR